MVEGLGVSFAGGYYGNKMFAGKTTVVEGVTEADILKISGLDKSKIDEIVSMPKGSRPDPATYLNTSYIEKHLKQFENGTSYIMPKSDYDFYYRGVPEISRPDGTMFFAPKDYMDSIIKEANSEWIPGGYTSGGIPEVILEHVPNDIRNIETVFLERK